MAQIPSCEGVAYEKTEPYPVGLQISMGNEIIAGNISKNPIETDGQNNGCSYCAYKEVCGFDTRLEGYEMRERLKTSEKDNIIEMMKNELEEE